MIQKIVLASMLITGQLCALDYYESKMVNNPDDCTACYNTGTCAFKVGDFAKAHSCFAAAIEHAEQLPSEQREQLYYNAGNTCMNLKNYQEAIDHYLSVLKENPDNEKAQRNLEKARQLLEQQRQQQQSEKEPEQPNKESGDEGDKNTSEKPSGDQDRQQNGEQDTQDGTTNNDQNKTDGQAQDKPEQHKDAGDKGTDEHNAQQAENEKGEEGSQHTDSVNNNNNDNKTSQDTTQDTQLVLTEQEQELIEALQERDAQARKAMVKSAVGQRTADKHVYNNW